MKEQATNTGKTEVLLISPPLYRLHGGTQASPPIGLLYISGYLNKNGIKTKVYNADYEGEFISKESEVAKRHKEHLENLNNPDFEAWKSIRRIVKEQSPKIVGISSVTASYISALNIAKIVREELPGAKVILGGVHVTAMPEESASEQGVDAVIIGEGEQTMLELAKGRNYGDIDGLCFKDKGKVIRTKPRGPIKDIDSLPFPVIEDMVFEKNKVYSFSEMFSSRGCPYNCIFCASAVIWGRTLRLRSPENIYKEMLFRKKKYGIKHFQFMDDALTLNKERILDVCRHIKELGVTWSCQTRANHVSTDMIRIMKASGCNEMAIGVESGNQKVLDIAKKSLKVEDVKKAFKIMNEEKIKTSAYFIFGLPGETEESIQDTFNLIEEIKPDHIVSNLTTPLPGTELFDMAKNNNWFIDQNWANYYLLGRTDSVVNIPTIERKKVVEAYLKLQKMADSRGVKGTRRLFLNPFFILKKVSIADLKHPRELWRKMKIFYNVLKG